MRDHYDFSKGKRGAVVKPTKAYKAKLKALRAHLADGKEQAKSGKFVRGFSMDSLIEDLDKDA